MVSEFSLSNWLIRGIYKDTSIQSVQDSFFEYMFELLKVICYG